MGKLRSIRGGRRPGYGSVLMAREDHWEIRQIYGSDGALAGDLLVLYTPTQVRAVVIMRAAPPEPEWEALDSWVLAQLDNHERRYIVDYYEGRYVTGVEGPPERPEGDDDDFGEE